MYKLPAHKCTPCHALTAPAMSSVTRLCISIGEVTNNWHSSLLLGPSSPTVASEDQAVRKLAAFFSHSEQVCKEVSVNITFDGLQIYLFSDMDEVKLVCSNSFYICHSVRTTLLLAPIYLKLSHLTQP